MKLEVRIEDGKPVIFLLSEIEENKVTCYTSKEGHCSATRGYMRSLPKPQTRGEILEAWILLERYANSVAYAMRL